MAQLILLGSESSHPATDLAREGATIGRAPDNTLPLNDKTVSRYHAEIRATDEGRWMVRDLASVNGTLINGDLVSEQVLEDGDVLTIGETNLRFRDSGGAVPPAPKAGKEEPAASDQVDIGFREGQQGLGAMAWTAVPDLEIEWPVGEGPGIGDPPLRDATVLHRPVRREPLVPARSEMRQWDRPRLIRHIEIYQQLHAALLSASDAGVLWTDILSIVRRLTEQPWAGALIPAPKGKTLSLQLSGEGGHSAEFSVVLLEVVLRSGEALHWHGEKGDPLAAAIAVPWRAKDGPGGVLFGPTMAQSAAEFAPTLELLAGVALELGHWWPTVTARWSGQAPPAPRPPVRPQVKLPPPL
ncbi:FHA domain-containing protein [Candidatus Sumerlaeota bacterium]|nr:FHA domain-containing protein [Candidatus Sumerlaeota bacterium]